MRCEQARDHIGLLVDGELSRPDAEALTAHAADCPDCARYRDELTRLRGLVRLARKPVPAKLAARVSAAISVETSDDVVPRSPGIREKLSARIARALASNARMAAAILLTCSVSIATTAWWVQRSAGEHALSRDALTAHLRSLIQDSPVQVASLDTHTVKPWFAGRLDYAPAVKDLSGDGFQLVGGRLDYVGGRRVAALTYKRRLHQISLFVWPSRSRAFAPTAAKFDGINAIGWSKAGMTYWAISDLNEGELRELQSLL